MTSQRNFLPGRRNAKALIGDKKSLGNSKNEKLYARSMKMRETWPEYEGIYRPSYFKSEEKGKATENFK